MDEIGDPQDDFAHAFEAAFGRLQVTIEEACAAEPGWPQGVAAAIRAAFEFAAREPAAAGVLTVEALARGGDGLGRHRRLVAYAADLLERGREERPEGRGLPKVLEPALAGGLAFFVSQRLDRGRSAELPGSAPEATEFVLAPYLGADELGGWRARPAADSARCDSLCRVGTHSPCSVRRGLPASASNREREASMLYALMGYVHAAVEGRVRAIRTLLAGERGQGTVEYVGLILLVSLLMVGMVAAMKGFNRSLTKTGY